ncbi:uncharacterized protein PHALS_12657 [Plasmopara halstedii]|uniref:BHLH domain-containing protein n=1 Tax=Plasmopara halstedii TaxID=4781 RepID=A0A0P1AMS4_PLAHL|nr:uncharacterized protein PHALS_12657 [Plasmopara halstedii]CEG42375.1 hypothetical protein PHALS_12657 [Plasmopara halstedii]|eukprot:XP_024578744.1 hypothetical protein PHALS_12657 [Plasmopara halstedii]
MLNTQVCDDAPSTLLLEHALAFVDACNIESDDETRAIEYDQELEALLAEVPDALLIQLSNTPKSPQDVQQPIGEPTGLLLSPKCYADSNLLESAIASLCTHSDTSSSSSDDGVDTQCVIKGKTSEELRIKSRKKMKRARAPSPIRTAKDFAAANAAIAAAAAGINALTDDTMKPTNKRIRKQREELLYLRVKVKEMENTLAELKRKETRSLSPSSSYKQRMVGDSDSFSLLASIWRDLAKRQHKDRERAEHENRKLKSILERQLQLTKCLKKIFETRPGDDVCS